MELLQDEEVYPAFHRLSATCTKTHTKSCNVSAVALVWFGIHLVHWFTKACLPSLTHSASSLDPDLRTHDGNSHASACPERGFSQEKIDEAELERFRRAARTNGDDDKQCDAAGGAIRVWAGNHDRFHYGNRAGSATASDSERYRHCCPKRNEYIF